MQMVSKVIKLRKNFLFFNTIKKTGYELHPVFLKFNFT